MAKHLLLRLEDLSFESPGPTYESRCDSISVIPMLLQQEGSLQTSWLSTGNSTHQVDLSQIDSKDRHPVLSSDHFTWNMHTKR